MFNDSPFASSMVLIHIDRQEIVTIATFLGQVFHQLPAYPLLPEKPSTTFMFSYVQACNNISTSLHHFLETTQHCFPSFFAMLSISTSLHCFLVDHLSIVFSSSVIDFHLSIAFGRQSLVTFPSSLFNIYRY